MLFFNDVLSCGRLLVAPSEVKAKHSSSATAASRCIKSTM